MNYEYSDKINFKSSKLRLVTDREGRLFVRKNIRADTDLTERLKSISCPYIVKFMECGEDKDGAYVIEEYVEGVTAAERTFTRKQAIKALIELCEALEVLHSAKIIHRDIKPSNLIIASDGHIRLIDFDASRIEKAVKDRDTQILGTEGFAPPEQFGFSQTDCRSDIYSFGVTMNMLLGDNSAPFIGIIRKCKALDPNDRYASISKVKTAIRLAMVKRLAAIPVVAALLAGFTVVFSTALKNRDRIDYTSEPYSESYINSTSVSGISHLPFTASQSESSSTPGSSGTSISDSSPVSEPSEISRLPAIYKPGESAQSTQTSEHAESSQSTLTSEPTESSSNTKSSRSTSVDQPTETNEFYHTIKDEYGHYNDVCSYSFSDDPSVHGSWRVIGTLKKNDLLPFLKGNTDLMYGGADTQNTEDSERAWIQRVTLSSDGTAAVDVTFGAKWTKGYIVLDYSDRHYVEELFSVTVNDTEYLMIEKKTEEYVKTGVSDAYFVYKREEEFEEPPEEDDVQTGKITYNTYLDDDGCYYDKCDYRFYDDSSVHGKWEIVGSIKPDQYDNWIAGAADLKKYSSTWLNEIEIYPKGDATINGSMKWLWTNGYLVRYNPNTVSALFTVTVDGTEYLVVENKNGDYRRLGHVKLLFVYTRRDG